MRAKWYLHTNPVCRMSCPPVMEEELPSCLFPGCWVFIQILWVSEFCWSVEFLISPSSFFDSVLTSFYIAFSLENVCSIQASAYSLLLNTWVNIHWISVSLFSSSLNKLSCLLLEATMSPLLNSRLHMCMKNPSEFIFISSATSPWLFPIVCIFLLLFDVNALHSPQKSWTFSLPCLCQSASWVDNYGQQGSSPRHLSINSPGTPVPKSLCHTLLPASQAHQLVSSHVRKTDFKAEQNCGMTPTGPSHHAWALATLKLARVSMGSISPRLMGIPIYTLRIILLENLRDDRSMT